MGRVDGDLVFAVFLYWVLQFERECEWISGSGQLDIVSFGNSDAVGQIEMGVWGSTGFNWVQPGDRMVETRRR